MYQAFVCKIKTRPHFDSKYEKIQIGTVFGSDLIISKDIQNGDLGIYFPPDGQLDTEYCIQNKLLKYHPETRESLGGYLEDNRRVKAIKICGIESQGIWIPVKSLSYLGSTAFLSDGDKFSKFGGIEIVKKYINPATLEKQNQNKVQNGSKKKVKVHQFLFPEHYDTSQWKFCHNIPKEKCLVFITEKLHGTSGRAAKTAAINSKVLKWYEKVLKSFGFKVQETETKTAIVCGSRKVNLGTLEDQNQSIGHYGSNSWRWDIIKPWCERLHEGEAIYYEIVGYINETPIQKGGKLDNKRLIKKYGKEPVIFHYGCVPKQMELYVYRITRIDQKTGKELELSWTQIQNRCNELGVKTVPELSRFVYDGNLENLNKKISSFVDGDSTLTSKHLREGVCIRFEQEDGIKVAKEKSFDYWVVEGRMKEDETYVDIEESEENGE